MIDHAIEIELEKARAARLGGKEGMARVCARRAAGQAAKTYLQQNAIDAAGPSAYDHLRALKETSSLSPRAQQAIERLLLRVNEDFQLPPGVDLIEEAQMLVNILA